MKGGLHARIQATALRKRGQHHGDVVPSSCRNNAGFSIVEVMIVLAVTGILFISAAVAISGRANKTQFQQSINQITDQIRATINEVGVGYYANMGNLDCTSDGSTLTLKAGNTEQGANSGCVFLGKAMQFGVAGTDPQQYVTQAIAGIQRDANGDEITSLANAKPAVIYPAAPQLNAPNDSVKSTLQYGLTVSKMYYDGNEANKIGAFALISSLGSYNGTELQSGSQQISLVPILTSALDQSIGASAAAINAKLPTSPVAPAKGVTICFDSGSTDQSGKVVIGGGNGRQLSVTLTIKGAKGC